MRYNLKFVESCKKTTIGLDGIIESLGGIPSHKATVVTYKDGSISSFKIEGELKQSSIPNRTNAIEVKFGDIVTSIGDSAFNSCSKLSSVIIPNSVTSIEGNAFSVCYNLSSIEIPSSVTNIGRAAFQNCYSLSSATIGNSVTNIEKFAFYWSGLKSINIPSSVTSIGDYAFSMCGKLKSIISMRTVAPTVQSKTFGDSSSNSYTGWNTHSTGDNVLKIPQGAMGYDSSYWLDPLQDATKCGFHIEYE